MAPKRRKPVVYEPYRPQRMRGWAVFIVSIVGLVIILGCIAYLAIQHLNGGSGPGNSGPSPKPTQTSLTGSFSGGSANCPESNAQNTSSQCVVTVTVPPGDSAVAVTITWATRDLVGAGIRDAAGHDLVGQVTGTTGTLALKASHVAAGDYALRIVNLTGTQSPINFAASISIS